jgi:acetyl-CoA carboxylase biotin carboxylase subunit
VHTTVPLLRDILADPVFREGRHITSFLDER